MKNFHPLSFGLGLLAGFLVLILFAGGTRLLRSSSTPGFPTNGGMWQQRQGGASGPNLARMAQRLGMTEQELSDALKSGKTMQDIAQERGVELPSGGRGTDRPFGQTASGAITSSALSSSLSSVPSQKP